MKKIKTTSYKALSLILTILSTGSHSLAAPSLIGGTIQYSKDSAVTSLNINCAGTPITTCVHETSMPKITYEIPKSATQTHFEVLVTVAKINCQLKQRPDQIDIQNTPDYIKIDPQSSYKYYEIDLVDDVWEIKEQKLPATGQIPDRAIIIECYPEWINSFKGGSSVELPTLYINNATIKQGKSDKEFEEDLIKLELNALDSKIINAPIRRQIQTASDKKRILIMDLIS